MNTNSRMIAFLFGLWESRGDCGITFYDDPSHPLSRAYDRGRGLGRKVLQLDLMPQ